MTTVLKALVTLALALPATAQDKAPTSQPHPILKDQTGIQWVPTFRQALAKAKKEGRLLLFLPLAGGTNRAGDW